MRLRLDPLGDDLHAEVVGERDDRLDDVGRRLVLEHRHDEAAVELDRVAGEAVELAQRRGAEAEVVDPRRHRVLVEQAAEHAPGGVRVVHHRALGDLEAQPARVQPRVVERVGDELDEAGVGRAGGPETLTETESFLPRGCLRQIASWRQACASTKRPSGRISPVSSAIATNSRGSIAVAAAVGPAAERLEAGDLAGRRLDHRLVEDAQLRVLERAAQAGLELEPRHHPLVHGLVEDRVARAALGLRAVHGDVGVAHDVLGRAVGGDERDADARRHVELAVVDLERRGQRLLQALGDDRGAADVADVVEQQRELVAAVARDGVAGAQRAFDPLRDRHQQAVADEVAERVVDELEAVEVEEQHGAAELAVVAARALRLELEAVEEERAVGQPGERVVQRVVAEIGELAQRARGDDRVGRAAASSAEPTQRSS